MSTLGQLYKRPSERIQTDHVSRIVGEANYSRLYFTDGSQVLFSRVLKSYQDARPGRNRLAGSRPCSPRDGKDLSARFNQRTRD